MQCSVSTVKRCIFFRASNPHHVSEINSLFLFVCLTHLSVYFWVTSSCASPLIVCRFSTLIVHNSLVLLFPAQNLLHVTVLRVVLTFTDKNLAITRTVSLVIWLYQTVNINDSLACSSVRSATDGFKTGWCLTVGWINSSAYSRMEFIWLTKWK